MTLKKITTEWGSAYSIACALPLRPDSPAHMRRRSGDGGSPRVAALDLMDELRVVGNTVAALEPSNPCGDLHHKVASGLKEVGR